MNPTINLTLSVDQVNLVLMGLQALASSTISTIQQQAQACMGAPAEPVDEAPAK